MFTLADIVSLAADESAINPALSPMSAVLILAAYGQLTDMRNWIGAGAELTAAEIDEIDAIVSTLYSELLA